MQQQTGIKDCAEPEQIKLKHKKDWKITREKNKYEDKIRRKNG